RKELSGYHSTEGCLYTNERVALVVLYCDRTGNFPARSVVVLEKNLGFFHFYEEKSPEFIDKAIRLQLFNGELMKVLADKPENIDIEQVDAAFALLSRTYPPACWSLNRENGDGCYKYDLSRMTNWFLDNGRYLADTGLWNSIFESVLF